MAFSRSNLSSTKENQNCFTTNSLASFALALKSAVGQTLPVVSSQNENALFSSRSAVLIGGTLHTCPPMTGPGSRCQNISLLIKPISRVAETGAAECHTRTTTAKVQMTSTAEKTHFHHSLLMLRRNRQNWIDGSKKSSLS